jgi:hypothetical protein
MDRITVVCGRVLNDQTRTSFTTKYVPCHGRIQSRPPQVQLSFRADELFETFVSDNWTDQTVLFNELSSSNNCCSMNCTDQTVLSERIELLEQFVLTELNWSKSSFEQFVLSELNWSDSSLKLTIDLRIAMVYHHISRFKCSIYIISSPTSSRFQFLSETFRLEGTHIH